MISAVAILDRTGEILAVRRYRRDFDPVALDNYRVTVIGANDVHQPAVLVDDVSFLHHLLNEVYYVAMTRKNANAGTIFEFLSRIPVLLKEVLMPGSERDMQLTASDIKKFAPEVMELLDEMCDCGYPQNTDADSLRLFTQRAALSVEAAKTEQVTIQATGATPWRPQGIVYRRNEVFVDVIERVSVLVSAAGKILDASVAGSVDMKVYLSGTPECKIGFNDKVSVDTECKQGQVQRTGGSIEVDDMQFHQCVKLTGFAQDRAISFVPPDGGFTLMKYRKTENIGVPFTITPLVHDLPGGKLEVRVNVRSTFDLNLTAAPLILTIPLPDNTSDVTWETSQGPAKWVTAQNAMVWRIASLPGKQQVEISLVISVIASTSKAQSPATKLQQPISAEFVIPMFSASGLALRYLKVVEKSGYIPEKWLRYCTKNGKYEVRLV